VGERITWSGKVKLPGAGLLEIGDDCIIESQAVLEAVAFVRGGLLVRPVKIGNRVKLGACSYVAPGTVLGDDCEVAAMAAIVQAVASPAGTKWEGVPATAHARAPEEFRRRLLMVAAGSESAWASVVEWLLWGGVRVARKALKLAISIYLVWLTVYQGVFMVAAGELPSGAFLLDLMLRICLARWLKSLSTGVTAVIVCRCLPRVKPGTYARCSISAVVAEFKIDVFEGVQKAMASSPFLSYWLYAMGVEVYPLVGNLEFGRMNDILPDAFAIAACNSSGENSNGHSLDITQEAVVIRQTTLTEGCFVGNNAFVPPGVYQKDLMLGVATNPAQGSYGLYDDTSKRPLTVFGNPPVQISRVAETAHEAQPTFLNFIFRSVFVELARGVARIPFYVVPMFLVGSSVYAHRQLHLEFQTLFLLAAPPLILWATVAIWFVLFLCVKWLVVGRATESTYVTRDPFVQQNFLMWRLWSWALPIFSLLGGTTALNPVLRVLGAHVGEGTLVLNQRRYFDMDMLHIGTNAVVNTIKWQLHTFEDSVLKLYPARIGDGALVSHSTIVGGASIGDGATLLPGSCVMKGEELADWKIYSGSPVAPIS